MIHYLNKNQINLGQLFRRGYFFGLRSSVFMHEPMQYVLVLYVITAVRE